MNITLGGSRGESGDSVKLLKLKNRHIYNMLTCWHGGNLISEDLNFKISWERILYLPNGLSTF